ncbi:ABC transporter substrate-binding protein [Rhodococcus aetherivorans]|uniref:ABC transporter substrate-binding protein n=1 Tax=Rhodococcus aetherivorans TaxID=191292 RepID=UPI0016396BAB|nr:ABC transporter substrate-binding protein [Rhodococcus aetherivorans]MBC2589687.1 ABC transporter substrate-binding protein [Rhodococcus aetherivorans]
MKNTIRRCVVSAAALSMLVLAGCSGAQESEPAAAPELTGPPIVVGTVCGCSGVSAPTHGRVDDVAQAWADSVNASGGINGHPVKIVVKDIGQEPSKALAAVKSLVEEEGAVAIVGPITGTTGSWRQYVEEKGIPVVGGVPSDGTFLVSDDFYIAGSPNPVITYGLVKLAKEEGTSKFGVVYCSESPVCADSDALAAKSATDLGLDYLSVKAAATAPNYTAVCQTMKNEGVDGIFLAHIASVDVRIAEDCHKIGYKPQFYTSAGTLGNEFVQSSATDGVLFTQSNAPYFDPSVPAVGEAHEILDSHYDDLTESEQFSAVAFDQWIAGKLFEAAAEQAQLTSDSTGADVARGLRELDGETLDGLAPPLTYSGTSRIYPTCYYVGEVRDGELKARNEGQTVCLDETDLQSELFVSAG